jgi:hypothetical protein
MSRVIPKRLPSILTSGLAAVLTGVFALAISGATGHQAHATPPGAPPVAEHFQALRGAPTGPLTQNPFIGQPGVDAARAHQLQVPGHNVWAIASNDQVCLSTTSQIDPSVVGGACAEASIVAEDGLVAGLDPAPAAIHERGLDPETTELTLLVPDGVRSVDLELSNGTSLAAAVTDNVAATILASRPTAARFVDAAGATRTLRLSNHS